jgi:hypothetical protein
MAGIRSETGERAEAAPVEWNRPSAARNTSSILSEATYLLDRGCPGKLRFQPTTRVARLWIAAGSIPSTWSSTRVAQLELATIQLYRGNSPHARYQGFERSAQSPVAAQPTEWTVVVLSLVPRSFELAAGGARLGAAALCSAGSEAVK